MGTFLQQLHFERGYFCSRNMKIGMFTLSAVLLAIHVAYAFPKKDEAALTKEALGMVGVMEGDLKHLIKTGEHQGSLAKDNRELLLKTMQSHLSKGEDLFSQWLALIDDVEQTIRKHVHNGGILFDKAWKEAQPVIREEEAVMKEALDRAAAILEMMNEDGLARLVAFGKIYQKLEDKKENHLYKINQAVIHGDQELDREMVEEAAIEKAVQDQIVEEAGDLREEKIASMKEEDFFEEQEDKEARRIIAAAQRGEPY